MRKCHARHIVGSALETSDCVRVLDVGGSDVNGSYREIFAHPRYAYTAADIVAGPGVQLVLEDPYRLALDDASIDVVISGQMLEHCEFFWLTFSEMVRVLRPGGFIFLIAPSAGVEHRYPVDCYRFYPDAYRALARHANCRLVEVWRDERGPWQDLVGVFCRQGPPPTAAPVAAPVAIDPASIVPGNEAEERIQGQLDYIHVLDDLHQSLAPRSYLEIGVRFGRSLALARGPAVGVDPAPEIRVELPASTRLFAQTSDDFFAEQAQTAFVEPIDFAFIDGLHLFETALRDFMNVERIAAPDAIVAIDDVLPNHPAQAARVRGTRVWMGDVWRLAHVLRLWRPDLVLALLDTSPSGLLLVGGLDPANRVLWENYNPIIRAALAMGDPPADVLTRSDAISLSTSAYEILRADLAAAAAGGARTEALAPIHLGRESARRGRVNANPPLSVIVVGYEMARELPRTIRSLSPACQLDIGEADYEILVVDNGSARPPTADAVAEWSPNARLILIENPTVSPVPAINLAMGQARGGVVGVLIDGARMASPRLLATALAASRLHERAVVGTLAFHLGPDVQMRSVPAGYDQAVEDALLAASGWEEDSYRLFGISTFAGSSENGWFITPSETNALFLSSAYWRESGGYDPRFVAPGGGLANLDIWERLCADPRARVILLMGEATFHQVHGGIATNAAQSPWDGFHEEYLAIRGKPFTPPQVRPLLIGHTHPATLPSLRQSLSRLMGEPAPRRQWPAMPVATESGPRDFSTDAPAEVLDRMQGGVLRSVYRGVKFLKSPLDIGLYLQLLSKLRPQSIIEIGCRFGGSALWFADMMAAYGMTPRVITVDIDPQTPYEDPRVRVIIGDAADLGACLPPELLADAPRPWLVVEDSSHFYRHSLAVLEYFHPLLQTGDYIVVEDGVVAHLPGEQYGQYENGPNRAVADFLAREGSNYRLDTDLCDFYGRNTTYNPNGWLQRL